MIYLRNRAKDLKKQLKKLKRLKKGIVGRKTSPAIRRLPYVARHTSPAIRRPPNVARHTSAALASAALRLLHCLTLSDIEQNWQTYAIFAKNRQYFQNCEKFAKLCKGANVA